MRRAAPVLLLSLFACKGEPPAYIHTVYVEALDTSEPGRARMRVRLVQADGSPAPAPDPRSVMPVAGDRSLASELKWSAVEPSDVSVVVVPDPGLDEIGRKAEAAIHASLKGAAGTLRRADSVQTAPAPMPLPGGTRARAPAQALAGAFEWLEGRPEGGRRVAMVSVRGNASGRLWNRQSARAVSAGADLIVLAFGRPGRVAPRPRAMHPLFVFPVDPSSDVKPVIEAVHEAVSGGLWAEFPTDLPAVEIATGLALRAKLPRGGWEDFALAPVETAPVRVVLDSIRAADAGRCQVGLRVLDATDRPIQVAATDVAYDGAQGPLQARPLPEDAPRSLVAVLDPYMTDGAALRTLTDAALDGLTAKDRAIILQAGPTPDPPPVLAPANEVRAAAASLTLPSAAVHSDLYAHLDEVERQLGQALADSQGAATVVVISGLHPVRAVESIGAPSPRLRASLRKWRRRGVVPIWAVLSPAAELRRFPLALARTGGVGVAGRDVASLAASLKTALAGRHAARHATVACPGGPQELAGQLKVRSAWRGRTASARATP